MQALSSSRCAFAGATRPQPVRLMAPSRTCLVVEAAVPKKKMSKSKTNIRAAAWKAKVLPYAEQALFKAKLALKAGDGSRESRDKDMSIASATAPAAESPAADSGAEGSQ